MPHEWDGVVPAKIFSTSNSREAAEKYRKNWDRIFGKKEAVPGVCDICHKNVAVVSMKNPRTMQERFFCRTHDPFRSGLSDDYDDAVAGSGTEPLPDSGSDPDGCLTQEMFDEAVKGLRGGQ